MAQTSKKTLIKSIITKHAKKFGISLTDVYFYSPKEWTTRRQGVGENALATVTFEGELYDAINYDTFGTNIAEKIRIDLLAHGLYYELGYAWSMHIYQI